MKPHTIRRTGHALFILLCAATVHAEPADLRDWPCEQALVPEVSAAVVWDGPSIEGLADTVIPVPSVDPIFSPVVNSVVLQLLAYHVARQRGCPIDFPRNLAKSVTVE